MALKNRFNRFDWSFSNQDGASATPGTSVTPGASSAEGSWTEIAGDADLTQDVYEVLLWITNGFTASTGKAHLLDLGVDDTGGTSYNALVSNIVCGGSSQNYGGGFWVRLPVFIKAGSAVAVRVQGASGTAGTVYVMGRFFGRPTRPDLIRAGQYSETIGTITSTLGVTVAAGTTGSEGSWVSIGTTSKPLWWLMPFWHSTSTGYGTNLVLLDVAFGDGSNKHILIEHAVAGCSSVSETFRTLLHPCYAVNQIPGGSTLYMRASSDSGSNATNHGVIVGIGG